MLEAIAALVRAAGFTLPPLLVMALLLWYALGLRWSTLRSVAAALSRRLSERDVHRLHGELAVGATLIRGVVLTAPLLGLLGTVTGMIETFDSLATQELFSRSGGIAGGVAEALLSTQVGLVVAIPGAIVGRLLGRHADHLAGLLRHVPT